MAEDKFVWYVPLPRLEEMAACAVSRSLWYSYMSRSRYKLKRILPVISDPMAEAFRVDHDYWDEADKEVESLKTSPSVEKLLKETVAKIRFNLWKLVDHFAHRLFSEELEEFNLGYFGYITKPNFCVWFPNNGEIDYQKTAVKMLSIPIVCNMNKFALMCLYCMEDEIRKFSLDFLPHKLKKVSFVAEPLLNYWIRFKKNEVRKMSFVGFTSIEALMASKLEDMEFWPAFEYFWHRLNPEEQLTLAKSRFTDCFNVYYKGFERLFSLLSVSQQRRLLSEIPTNIIWNFAIRMNSPRSTLWAWMHCKDSLSGKQFCYVITSLISETKEERTQPLLEIWNTATDQQRNYVAQKITSEFIEEFDYEFDPPSSAFSFLREFLALKDANFRKKLILKHAPQFGSSMSDACTMNDILNLCLPDSNDLSKFKSLVANSEEMTDCCNELRFKGDFEKIDVMLEFYLSDENARRKFKDKILEKIRFEDYAFDENKWNGLSKFIDEALPCESALKKKKNIIIQFASKFPHYNSSGNRLDHMPTMFLIVESIFADNMLKAVKQTFFKSFLKKVAMLDEHDDWQCYFHENYFLKFVRWAIGEDIKSIIKYQNGELVDTVFKVVFQILNQYYEKRNHFFLESLVLDMDKCLSW